MPVRAAWFDDNQDMILEYFSNPWNWGDFYATQYQVQHMLAKATYPVDIIIDFTNGNVMPTGALKHLRRLFLTHQPNRGRIVMIGAHETVCGFHQILTRLYPHMMSDFMVANDLDTALTILNRNHASTG